MPAPNRTCLQCGKSFYAKPSAKRTTCSKECQYQYFRGNGALLPGAKRGANNAKYSGGVTYNDGYVLVKRPEHPRANSKGYIRMHRVVMEDYLGRYLTDDEEVHHRNRDRTDNNLLNLMVFKNNADHKEWHKRYPDPEPYLEKPWSPDVDYWNESNS